MTKILLEAGAKQTASMEGATPLIQSLQYNNPKIALALLDKCPKSHLNRPDRTGARPLHLAAIRRHKNVS